MITIMESVFFIDSNGICIGNCINNNQLILQQSDQKITTNVL